MKATTSTDLDRLAAISRLLEERRGEVAAAKAARDGEIRRLLARHDVPYSAVGEVTGLSRDSLARIRRGER